MVCCFESHGRVEVCCLNVVWKTAMLAAARRDPQARVVSDGMVMVIRLVVAAPGVARAVHMMRLYLPAQVQLPWFPWFQLCQPCVNLMPRLLSTSSLSDERSSLG